MTTMKATLSTLLFSLMALLVTTAPAHAEQMHKMGNWDVHYIALGSTFLTPKVAKTYGLVRSKYNGIINISILKRDKGGKAEQVSIQGTAKNLVGNTKKLQFKEITEGESVYYIAQLSYSNEETFSIEITMRQGNREERFTFSETFYAE